MGLYMRKEHHISSSRRSKKISSVSPSMSRNLKSQTILKRMNCHPGRKYFSKNTCYTRKDIQSLKTEFNKKNTRSKIKTKKIAGIMKELHEKLPTCTKEDCYVDQLYSKTSNVKKQEIFSPYRPSSWTNNPTEWLSNEDIRKVLKQYENVYSDFLFIEPSPIDYDTRLMGDVCVNEQLCHFNLQTLKKKYNQIGIIFNIDKHDQGGSHWVSLFIDIRKKIIFYFDSVGNPIPNEIQELVTTIIKQSNNTMKFYTSRLEHQRGNTECGMYSLYFIISMLDKKVSMTKKMRKFQHTIIPDKFVQSLRNKLFN